MKNKVIYMISFYSLMVFASIPSCDDCGGLSDTKFKVVELSEELQKATKSTTNGNWEFTDLSSDSIFFFEYAIHLIHEIEYFSDNRLPSFNLIQSAYACDPEPARSQDRLENIIIRSNTAFNTDYPAGANLSELFDVVVYSNDLFYERLALSDYLATMPEGPYQLVLLLNEQPSETQSFSFDIEYHQDGVDFDLFEFSTEAVVIKKV